MPVKGSVLAFDGYHLPKTSLKKEQIADIKKFLTVVPIDSGYGADDENAKKYKIYKETETHITIPRYYGIEKYGDPEKTTFSKTKVNINFTGTLRDYQNEIVTKCLDHVKKYGGGLMSVPCGFGKCMAKGTLVIMSDGSTKPVEDIKVGEKIMGDDSTPRTILSLARGREEMFDIIQSKGEKYTVNKSHILSLKNGSSAHFKINGVRYEKGDVLDISVEDYLKLPKMYNNSRGSPLRGYRVPLNFPEKQVSIDPYFLGAWLGDGTSKEMHITSIDKEIIDYTKKYAESLDLVFKKGTANYAYYAIGKKEGQKLHPLKEKFKVLNLINNKHIPDIYKYNSRDVRLKVLAGLMDTDGSLHNGCFDFVQKNERLFDDVIYLARSLGFACYKSKCQKKCYNSPDPNHNGTYYRCSIMGDLNEVPTLLPRKQAPPRQQIKNVLNYGITVKSIGEGDYYGFEIDGNKRFVLGDFSVTHNTSMAIYLSSQLGLKTLVLTHKSFLQDQWVDRIKQFTTAKVGTIRQDIIDVEGKDFVIGMIQSISKRQYDPEIFKEFGVVIIDESHRFASKYFSNALYKVGARYTIALTATPKRADGLMRVVNWFTGDIMFQKKLQINNRVVTKIITFLSTDELFKEVTVFRKVQKGGKWVSANKPDFVQMLSNLIEIKERNELIINILDTLRKNPDRKILVLSERINHLKTLKELLDDKIQQSVDSGEILKGECKTYLYIGELKRNHREEAEKNADILFGSYKMAEEGLDIERLNTLIFATPKKDVIQSCGRILRKITDTVPLIIDISDKLSVFSSQAKKREDYYTKCKYLQHFYYTYDGNLISPSKYLDLTHNSCSNANTEIPKSFNDILEVPEIEIIEKKDKTTNDSQNDSDDEKPKKSNKLSKLTKSKETILDSDDEKPKKKSKKKVNKVKDDDEPKSSFKDWFG